ncbi:hypothetical protein AB6A23_24510 [Paenibacillus tarimensis]
MERNGRLQIFIADHIEEKLISLSAFLSTVPKTKAFVLAIFFPEVLSVFQAIILKYASCRRSAALFNLLDKICT